MTYWRAHPKPLYVSYLFFNRTGLSREILFLERIYGREIENLRIL